MYTGAKRKNESKMSYEILYPDAPFFLDIDTEQFLGTSNREMGGNTEIHQYSMRASWQGVNQQGNARDQLEDSLPVRAGVKATMWDSQIFNYAKRTELQLLHQ